MFRRASLGNLEFTDGDVMQSSRHMGTTGRIKTLHVSMLGIPLRRSPGFKAQLAAEWRCANQLRETSTIDWRTVLLVPATKGEDYSDFSVPVVEIPKTYPGRLARRVFLWKYVRTAAKSYDVVLVRHSVVDPFESLCLRRHRNVAIVHHTKSVEELVATGHPVLARVESVLRRLNKSWARWPIGVTGELSQCARGKGCAADHDLVLPNGIEISQSQMAVRLPTGGVQVLFIASNFAPWHGLDRLLGALTEWSPKRGERLTLHLVGDLTEAQILDIEAVRSDRVAVRIYGMLDAESITQLFMQADVGIGSLALDRKGMRDACTLKVREYLAAGVAVYSGHRDSGLPDDFPYYLKVASVDIAELVEYALRMRSVNPGAIRQAAEEHISKEAIMRRAATGMLLQIRDYARLGSKGRRYGEELRTPIDEQRASVQ